MITEALIAGQAIFYGLLLGYIAGVIAHFYVLMFLTRRERGRYMDDLTPYGTAILYECLLWPLHYLGLR